MITIRACVVASLLCWAGASLLSRAAPPQAPGNGAGLDLRALTVSLGPADRAESEALYAELRSAIDRDEIEKSLALVDRLLEQTALRLRQADAAGHALTEAQPTHAGAGGVPESAGPAAEARVDVLYPELRRALDRSDLATAHALVDRLLAKTMLRLGLAQSARHESAAAAIQFERVLAIDPGNDRARLELARVLLATGNAQRAAQEVQTVLDHNPPPAVRRNIQKFMDRIRQAEKRGGWGLALAVGGLYDDNVNVGPATDRIRIEPLHLGDIVIDGLDVSPDSRPKDAWGLYTYAILSGRYDTGNRGGWSLNGSASYYQTWLADEPDWALRWVRLQGGFERTDSGHVLELPFVYQHIDRGQDPLANTYGVAPSRLYACGPWYWITSGTAEYRDYANLDARNSAYLEVRETVRRYFGAARHSLSFGTAGFYEDAETDSYDNGGGEAFLAGEANLAWRSRLYARLLYRGTWYDAREVLAPAQRRDNEWQASVGLSKQITDRWATDLGYQHTDNRSTFDLYQYKRNMVTLGASAEF